MKKVLIMTAFALAFFINISSLPISGQTLLNEIDINPPGDDESCEYIEIRGTPGATLNNLYFAIVEGDATAAGQVDFFINLSGRTIGVNGLLVIVGTTPCIGRTIPAQTTQVTSPKLTLDGGNIENGSNSFLLISSPNIIPDGSLNFDPDGDGTLNLPPGASLVDGIG